MTDTHLLKISGKAELPKPIEIGHNYRVAMEGSVISQTKSDNENGEFTFTYLFKPVKIELLTSMGEMLKLKDPRKYSQLFRARVWTKWKAQDTGKDFDAYYEKLMMNLIQRVDEITEMYGE